ncbi:hypothetical protein ACN22W_30805 [Burkholderia theae]|uniref:hypothetical protein n=1 Tax=Burkholderia theae TaxID=3143496 RepID=UPI003AFAB892
MRHSVREPRDSPIPPNWNFSISFNTLIAFFPAIRSGAHTAFSISEMTCCLCRAGQRTCRRGFRRDIAHADITGTVTSDKSFF